MTGLRRLLQGQYVYFRRTLEWHGWRLRRIETDQPDIFVEEFTWMHWRIGVAKDCIVHRLTLLRKVVRQAIEKGEEGR